MWIKWGIRGCVEQLAQILAQEEMLAVVTALGFLEVGLNLYSDFLESQGHEGTPKYTSVT